MDGFFKDSNQLMQLSPFQGDTLPSRQFSSCGFVHGRRRTSGPLGYERRCTGEGYLDYFGVNSPFKPERGIGGKAVALGHFSRHDRIEVGRLEEYPGRRLRNAACVTSKHTGQAHGFVGVCDDLVFCMEGAFLSIERRQFLAGMGYRTTTALPSPASASKACSGWPISCNT